MIGSVMLLLLLLLMMMMMRGLQGLLTEAEVSYEKRIWIRTLLADWVVVKVSGALGPPAQEETKRIGRPGHSHPARREESRVGHPPGSEEQQQC